MVARRGHAPREYQRKRSDPLGKVQVCLLASRSYKVSATVGVSTVVATPVYAILDTGAGQNLVREDVLTEDWLIYSIADDPNYQVIGASGRDIPQWGVITLWVQLGRLRAQARLIVLRSLVA
jgi:hypothetical protein